MGPGVRRAGEGERRMEKGKGVLMERAGRLADKKFANLSIVYQQTGQVLCYQKVSENCLLFRSPISGWRASSGLARLGLLDGVEKMTNGRYSRRLDFVPGQRRAEAGQPLRDAVPEAPAADPFAARKPATPPRRDGGFGCQLPRLTLTRFDGGAYNRAG